MAGRVEGDLGLYAEGLRTAARQNSVAYGYSIMITASFGAIVSQEPRPRVWECFLFAAGAVLGFTLVLLVATRGFRQKSFDADRPEVLVVAALLNLASVASGVGAASLVAWLADGWWVWLVGALGASLAYEVVNGLEYMAAEREEEPRRAEEHEQESED